MRKFQVICGSALLVAAVWFMTRSAGDDGEVPPVDRVDAEPRSSSAPERHATDATDHSPLVVSSRRALAEKRTIVGHDREPPATAKPESGEPVELAPFQERALEQTKYGLVELLQSDLAMGVEICVKTKLDEPPVPHGQIELYVDIAPHGGEARTESVSYGEGTEVDDPRLLECLHELIGEEVIPAEVLDEMESEVLTVRVGPLEAKDDAEGPQARPNPSP